MDLQSILNVQTAIPNFILLVKYLSGHYKISKKIYLKEYFSSLNFIIFIYNFRLAIMQPITVQGYRATNSFKNCYLSDTLPIRIKIKFSMIEHLSTPKSKQIFAAKSAFARLDCCKIFESWPLAIKTSSKLYL